MVYKIWTTGGTLNNDAEKKPSATTDQTVVELPVSRANANNGDGPDSTPDAKPVTKKKRIKGVGVALGGGAARGWAHIGVMRALDDAGVPVSMIAGTSIGALVGGCYLAGKLDELEEFARSVSRRTILRFMDFSIGSSGLIAGDKLAERLQNAIGDMNIEDLDRRFVAIATDIHSGNEIWLETGNMAKAIRASYALPGVFEPIVHLGRDMVDGALVNPVPVSACRAYEQKVVIAVNLGGASFGRSAVIRSPSLQEEMPDDEGKHYTPEPTSWLPFLGSKDGRKAARENRLGVTGVMMEAFNIIQEKIVRSRLAGDPPDFTIRPDLDNIGLADFHKAEEAIAIGYMVTATKISALEASGLRNALEG